MDLGKFEGVMTSRERVPNEDYSVGDRMRFYVVEVRTEARGPKSSFPAAIRTWCAASLNRKWWK